MERRGDRGAAAVEFALVMPILLLLLFAIINYGLIFNDSNNARQGTREATRRAVVGDLGTCSGNDTAKLVCMTKSSVGALSGAPYVSVRLPSTWAKGNPLIVCVVIVPNNLTGFIPMPRSISSSTSMSIEVDSPSPGVGTSAETLPSGLSWPAGCT